MRQYRSPRHALLVPSTFWQFSLESKLNMATISSSSNDEIIAALNVIEDIISRLNSLGDPDCVEGIALRCEVLKRHFVNIGIDDTTLEWIDLVCRSLHQFGQRSTVSNNLTFPTKVHNGY